MWEAVAFTVVASAGNNIGKVLQKQGTKGLPQLSLKLKVIQSYFLSGTWLTGVAVDILGGLLMLRAVSQAPVSVVQPVSGVGLAVLAVFSHFYLREAMQTLDWLAVAMAAAGTIGNNMEVMDEMSAGLQAGAFFGLSAVVCKLGFILAQNDMSNLYIPAGVIASIACSAGGFFCQTRGLKDGRAVVVSTCAAVASIVTGVLVGLLALGESLPVSPIARIFLCSGWAFIILGIILLLTSEKIARNLPRSIRRFIKTKSTMSGKFRGSQGTMPIVNPLLKSPPMYRV